MTDARAPLTGPDTDLEPVLAAIADELADLPGILFTAVFGSCLEGGAYRDIDVAVLVDRAERPRERDLEIMVNVSVQLTRRVGMDVDLRVVNDAPAAFRYQVTRGRLLTAADEEAWHTFRERTWKEYFDLKPFLDRYFEEAAG